MSTLPDFSGETSAPDTSQDQGASAAAPAAVEAQQDGAPASPPASSEPAQPGPAAAGGPATEGATQADVDQAAAMNVPLATFLDMRDRANNAELEARRLREWRQQQEAVSRRQAPPDPTEDPEGYQVFRDRQFAGQMRQQTLFFSRRMAEKEHGRDVVAEAYKWGFDRCDQDPHFNARVAASEDPIELVVSEWKRDKFLAQANPDDFQAFLDWKATQANGGQPLAPNGNRQPAPGPAATRTPPQAPRPSLAAAPSAGTSADPQALDGAGTYRKMFGGA